MDDPERLWAGALVRHVMEDAPKSLDVTRSVSSPSVARFGPAEVPSGSRRVLAIGFDWSARGGSGAMRWTIYNTAGEPTDSGLVRVGSIAVIIAAMERAVR